jgi:putative acetyltransferase
MERRKIAGDKSAGVLLREFEPGDEAAFRRLNEEWIARIFKLEPKDEYAFANPRETILDHGGRIFFALRGGEDGEIVGCCGLMAMGESGAEFEVAKMAVTASAQGLGLGRTLLEHTVNEARRMGARRLYLETNHALGPAIHLYEEVGFEHLPPERVTASPYARADVYMEMWL